MANTAKPMAVDTAQDLIKWLEPRGVRPLLSPDGAERLGRPDLAARQSEWGETPFVVVLGGDGTLLRAAKTVAPQGLPVLGVNTGHLGFLTELEPHQLFTELPGFLDGRYEVEERMMLEARVSRDESTLDSYVALNDAVIGKGLVSRLLTLTVTINDTLVTTYPADGVICATPTGSTAYSLSAGGPVAQPNLDVMLVTPICPHSFHARPLVVSASETVRIILDEAAGETMLTIDGQASYHLERGDEVHVSRSDLRARLVRLPGYRFYEVLKRKLGQFLPPRD